ncbi:MAG: hypothetical protein HY403_04970 [Elusimicrobia bacterium]|nr:hypothetical protein [Elusimicrobiota bacterium]
MSARVCLLAAALLGALAPAVRARGENDEDVASPGLIPAGSFMLFYKTQGPLSFVAMTPKDRPKGARELGTVKGVSCQHGLSIPISADVRGTSITGAYGNGSFVKAIERIKKEKPEVVGIYDVRTDLRIFSLLGIYRRLCTEVTARAFALS